jgi:hypothetical protein
VHVELFDRLSAGAAHGAQAEVRGIDGNQIEIDELRLIAASEQ